MVYSIDFREKVVSVYNKQKLLRKTAELLEVSYNFVQDMASRWKAGETPAPKPHQSGNIPQIQDSHIPFLMEMIENENDLTLEEMRRRLYERFNLKTGSSTWCESLGKAEGRQKKLSAIRRRQKKKMSQKQ